MIPIRDNYFNVPDWAIFTMYVLAVVVAIVYIRKVYCLVKRWRESKVHPAVGSSQVFQKIRRYVLAQKSLFDDRFAGIMHGLIFWGFLGLFGITLLVLLEVDTPLHFLEGRFFVIFSFMGDLFGIMLLLGLMMALWRRTIKPPRYLSSHFIDLILLFILLVITLSGFLVESLRIALSGYQGNGAFIGANISQLFIRASAQDLSSFHFVIWFVHMVLVFGLLCLIPYTKLLHALVAPLNIALSEEPGTLSPQPAFFDIGKTEYLGIGSLQDLTVKNLMDLFSCAACGRCEENCPAVLTQKQLSPKRVVQSLRYAQMHSTGLDFEPLDIWNCTTCGFCTQKCPVAINHQEIVWGVKTYLTTRGHLPAAGAKALENIEYLGDPWGTTYLQRSESRGCLPRSGAPSSKTPQFVYWTGCSISNDQRFHAIAAAFVRLLTKAGANFKIFEGESSCCGDPARRLGEEGLFQRIVQDNIRTLNEYAGSTLVTHCPHCYHTLKNEYAQFGLDLDVKHHSEAILELMLQGRLEAPMGYAGRISYHDPCYLGRHNNLYEPVRMILQSSSGFDLSEPVLNRDWALCCGGGGGHMWLESQAGQRASHLLLDELTQNKPDFIATACPYCALMLEDSVSFKGLSHLEIKDIAELFS